MNPLKLERLREITRLRRTKNRLEFFKGKSCAHCAATERLELDHVNPADKSDHRIWTWSESRRNAELAKCQVLCVSCHRKKSAEESRVRNRARYERTRANVTSATTGPTRGRLKK